MMTLKEFIKQYDKDDSVVLLEGKRNVLDEDREKLTNLGILLASNTKKILFRSGNAGGADHLFSLGVATVDNAKLQAVIPYTGHREKTNHAYHTISLDAIDLAAEGEVVRLSKLNRKTARLVDRYVSGARDQYAMRAAYIIRDTIKVTGTRDIKAAAFAIFYDDLAEPMTGGTGHTMNVCLQNGIPVIDQGTWFKWLE
jgi:hypothetical protein